MGFTSNKLTHYQLDYGDFRYYSRYVKKFIYLGSAVTIENVVSLEIKRRITLVNPCYYGPNRQLNSSYFSRSTKLIICKTLILTVLLNGA